jgi:hypothetical protein
MALPNPVRQQAARKTLMELLAHPETVYAVHYACQSFYQDSQVASPRVGAISLRQLSTGQVTSFSIAQVAELNGLEPEAIPALLDRIERKLLEGYFEFVRGNKHARYLHWNMRDQQFGFAALEHRQTVLGGIPYEIAESHRFDLATLVEEIYGADYVAGRAKLKSLAEINELVTAGFLAGRDEAAAMDAARYRDLANSTLAKVRVIADIAQKTHDRTLATEASFMVEHAGPIRLLWSKVIDNPIPSIIATFGSAFFLAVKVMDYFAKS